MHRSVRFVLISACVFVCSAATANSHANAQANVQANKTIVTALRKSDHTLLGVMNRFHCPALWVSRVMWASDIDREEVNFLQPNRRIVLPNACKGGGLSHQEILDSQAVLAQPFIVGEQVRRREVTRLSRENIRLRKELAQKNVALAEAASVPKPKPVKSAEKTNVIVIPVKSSGRGLSIGMLMGLGAALAIMAMYYFFWLKTRYVLAKREVVKNASRTKKIKYRMNQVTYTCPEHSLRPILAEHLDRHTGKAHAIDRMTVVDETEMPPVEGLVIT